VRDCVAEVERDKLRSLEEEERGDSHLKHGDLRCREAVQGPGRAGESLLGHFGLVAPGGI